MRNGSSALLPPDGGWSLVEAAAVLLPHLAASDRSASDSVSDDARHGADLMLAIAARRDLILIGRYIATVPDSAPVRVPRELYRTNYTFDLLIAEGILHIAVPAPGVSTGLEAVRVLAVKEEGPPADFPLDAIDAIPLAGALITYSDPRLLQQHADTLRRVRREGRWAYDPDHRHDRNFDVLSEFDGHGQALMRECIKLMNEIKAGLVTKLRSGELTGWAREGSPIASPCEVPATAWSLIRLTRPRDGTATGPNTNLFDVHVGPRFFLPLVPVVRPLDATSTPPVVPTQRGQGGRPERYDWQPFDHEVSRRLALDGGDTSRAEFRRAMKDWVSLNITPAPDDRTIERRLDKLVAPDILPD